MTIPCTFYRQSSVVPNQFSGSASPRGKPRNRKSSLLDLTAINDSEDWLPSYETLFDEKFDGKPEDVKSSLARNETIRSSIAVNCAEPVQSQPYCCNASPPVTPPASNTCTPTPTPMRILPNFGGYMSIPRLLNQSSEPTEEEVEVLSRLKQMGEHIDQTEALSFLRDSSTSVRKAGLPKVESDILRLWFYGHRANPYPTPQMKRMLMKETGFTQQQLRNWFSNFRKRHWIPLNRGLRAPKSHVELALYVRGQSNMNVAEKVGADENNKRQRMSSMSWDQFDGNDSFRS